MKETIFYVSFRHTYGAKEITRDEEEYFPLEKTLKEFFDWMQQKREEFKEYHSVSSCVITNIQFIQK